MNFKDKQDKSDDVKRAVTRIILDASDTVEMLNEADGRNEKGFIDIYDLIGTEYEDMVPDFISVKVGDSWVCRGRFLSSE